MFTVHLLGSSDNHVLLQHLRNHSCPSSRLPSEGSTLLRFAEQSHGVLAQHHPWAFLFVGVMDGLCCYVLSATCLHFFLSGSSGHVPGSWGALLALHMHYCFLSVFWPASG